MKMVQSLLLGISAETLVEYELRSDTPWPYLRGTPRAGTFQYKADCRAQ